MRSHFCWKCIDFSHGDRIEAVSSFSTVTRDHRQNWRIWQCALMHAALLDFISSPSPHPCLPSRWQHVVSLIAKALFCMQIPAPPSLSAPPVCLLPSNFQLRSRQRYTISTGDAAGCLTAVRCCSRQWKGCGGVVYWVTVDSDDPHLVTLLYGSFVFSVITGPPFKTADGNLSLNLN